MCLLTVGTFTIHSTRLSEFSNLVRAPWIITYPTNINLVFRDVFSTGQQQEGVRTLVRDWIEGRTRTQSCSYSDWRVSSFGCKDDERYHNIHLSLKLNILFVVSLFKQAREKQAELNCNRWIEIDWHMSLNMHLKTNWIFCGEVFASSC